MQITDWWKSRNDLSPLPQDYRYSIALWVILKSHFFSQTDLTEHMEKVLGFTGDTFDAIELKLRQIAYKGKWDSFWKG